MKKRLFLPLLMVLQTFSDFAQFSEFQQGKIFLKTKTDQLNKKTHKISASNDLKGILQADDRVGSLTACGEYLIPKRQDLCFFQNIAQSALLISIQPNWVVTLLRK
jgi:hypothetical protein